MKAHSDLILAISPSELKQIKGCDTAHAVWEKLHSIYQSKGPARKATLLKQLMLHKMAEKECVREHIRNFFDAVDKLQEMEVEINEDLLTIMLLYSLPPSYENFRCAIETRDDLPKPESLKIKIIEESDARKSSHRERENSAEAMLASSANRGHYKKQGWKGKKLNVDKEDPKSLPYKCHKCRKPGHKANDCHSKVNKKTENASKAEEMGFLITTNSESALKTEGIRSGTKWCLDSGCTCHMCYEEEKFINSEKCITDKLNLANSATTTVEAKGTVKISVNDNNQRKTLNLDNTLLVPDLRTNLISVGKITDNGYEVTFKRNSAVISDKNGSEKLFAHRIDGLYYLNEPSELASVVLPESDSDQKLKLWHHRLGHLNETDVKSVMKNQGIKISDSEKLGFCETCALGKLTQKPFPKSSSRETNLLELVHTDLYGPMRTESIGKAKYFVTFIEDSTRICDVKFLKRKSDLLEAFKSYKTMIENKTGKKIKYLQSDNGREYRNVEMDRYLDECGISRRYTVPHSPQQNGVAERRNRTLIEMARCFLIDSNLPPAFWAEAVSTANHIRNRYPSRSLNGKIPLELLTGTRLDLSHLRTFGCKGYALDKSPGKGKLQPRARKCIFLGYSTETKGYRVWLSEEKKVEISRDIKLMNEFLPKQKFDDFISIKSLEAKEDEDQIKAKNWVEIEYSTTKSRADDIVNPREIDNSDDDDEYFLGFEFPQEEHNEEYVPIEEERRLPGRPRIVRTGLRGRPRKVHRTFHIEGSSENYPEFVNIAEEISMKEALGGSDADDWNCAIQEEFESLIKNRTWDLVNRPDNCSTVGNRLVLRNKFNAEGNLEKRKARLVAR